MQGTVQFSCVPTPWTTSFPKGTAPLPSTTTWCCLEIVPFSDEEWAQWSWTHPLALPATRPCLIRMAVVPSHAGFLSDLERARWSITCPIDFPWEPCSWESQWTNRWASYQADWPHWWRPVSTSVICSTAPRSHSFCRSAIRTGRSCWRVNLKSKRLHCQSTSGKQVRWPIYLFIWNLHQGNALHTTHIGQYSNYLLLMEIGRMSAGAESDPVCKSKLIHMIYNKHSMTLADWSYLFQEHELRHLAHGLSRLQVRGLRILHPSL